MALDLQLAGFEDPPVVVAQDRQEHAITQVGLGRVPVDVEVAGVPARRPVLQDVPPPGILGSGDRHVIGHDVDDLAKVVPPEPPAEGAVTVVSAELAVDPVRVHDVVPVFAPRRRLEDRRGVGVADPEPLEVGDHGAGSREAERRAELQPIGRPGDGSGGRIMALTRLRGAHSGRLRRTATERPRNKQLPTGLDPAPIGRERPRGRRVERDPPGRTTRARRQREGPLVPTRVERDEERIVADRQAVHIDQASPDRKTRARLDRIVPVIVAHERPVRRVPLDVVGLLAVDRATLVPPPPMECRVVASEGDQAPGEREEVLSAASQSNHETSLSCA